jgi:hypothetical protein
MVNVSLLFFASLANENIPAFEKKLFSGTGPTTLLEDWNRTVGPFKPKSTPSHPLLHPFFLHPFPHPFSPLFSTLLAPPLTPLFSTPLFLKEKVPKLAQWRVSLQLKEFLVVIQNTRRERPNQQKKEKENQRVQTLKKKI